MYVEDIMTIESHTVNLDARPHVGVDLKVKISGGWI